MTADEKPDNAGVLFPPPIFVFICLAIAWFLDRFVLSLPFHFSGQTWLGWGLFGMALIVIFLNARLFRSQHTAIEPWKPTKVLVISGMYRFSRNPIYLAFLIGFFGLGISMGSFWFLPLLFCLYVFLRLLVIRREEQYLLRRFGADYESYRRKVRRWL